MHIGYHYLIENGRPLSAKEFFAERDGAVRVGRHEDEIGAHAEGFNNCSLGVCLVGRRGLFTGPQMAALEALVVSLCLRYGIESARIRGHCEVPSGRAQGKTCPELDMPALRARVQKLIEDAANNVS